MIIRKIILLFILVFVSSIWAQANPEKDRYNTLWNTYCNSLGYISNDWFESLVEEKDSVSVDERLESNPDAYFKYSALRIIGLSRLSQNHVALTEANALFSKAQALEYHKGLVWSYFAMGISYFYGGMMEQAEHTLYEALEVNRKEEIEDIDLMIYFRLLFVNMHNHNVEASKQLIERIDKLSTNCKTRDQKSLLAAFHVIYEKKVSHSLKNSSIWMERMAQYKKEGCSESVDNYCDMASAYHVTLSQKWNDAIHQINVLLDRPSVKDFYLFYVDLSETQAMILEKNDRLDEAYILYQKIQLFMDKTISKRNSDDIEKVYASFQQNQLMMETMKTRKRSTLIGVIGGGALLVLFAILCVLSVRSTLKLRKMEKEQVRMKERAEEAIRSKNMFLSNMSHEIRTPLNAIVGFANLLTTPEVAKTLDKEQRDEMNNVIHINSDMLLKLVNDIIDIDHVGLNDMSFDVAPCDAVQLCREVMETVKGGMTYTYQMEFRTQLDHLELITDHGRLRQVITNLLTNAKKFTKEGSIVLELSLVPDGSQALFTVTDTGCGIPLEKQKQVFNRYEKLNEFAQGTGLGLSISKHIVNHFGGEIWVDGSYTQGARFCFTHRLAADEGEEVKV